MPLMTRQELAETLEALSWLARTSMLPSSFPERLRIQKSVYLLKALGDPACSGYSFNLYFHGPYSPDLAKDYYDLPSDHVRSGREVYESAPQDGRRRLDVVSIAIQEGNHFLEAVTTIHSITSRNPRASRAEILTLFTDLKPELADRFEGAFTFLLENGLVAART
jgi:uncharacterized protein YwgA